MKNFRKISVTLLLIIMLIFSAIPANSVALSSIKKNYDFHYGLDVSTWNNSLNMTKIKNAGVEFAFIRVGWFDSEGGHLDVRFKENVKKCAENGIEFGIYVYSYVYKADDTKKCAKWVHKQLSSMGNYCKNKKIIPVAYDIEDSVQSKAVSKKKISKNNLLKNVCKFCDKIKGYGYVPVVYSFQSFFEKYLDISKLQDKDYKIWYAQWPYYNHLDTTVEKEMYNGETADVWQFSDYLTVGGKRFDTNVCYDNFYDYSKENSNIKVEELKEVYSLNKETVKPSAFKVYNGSTLLKKGKDYKLAYFRNDRAGTAKLKVIRYKNSKYLETKTFFFDVKPRTPQNIETESYLNKVGISWDKSKGASYYEIYQLDENDGKYNLIDTVKTNSYTNSDVQSGTMYDMKIRAVYDKNGKKYYSKYTAFLGHTKYPKLTIDYVTSNAKKSVTVKWVSKKENCTGYEIQYATNSSFKKAKKRIINGITRKRSTFSKLKSGKKYYFRVRAFNEMDEDINLDKVYSTYSKVLNVKVK